METPTYGDAVWNVSHRDGFVLVWLRIRDRRIPVLRVLVLTAEKYILPLLVAVSRLRMGGIPPRQIA
jgi:hypothetical protein